MCCEVNNGGCWNETLEGKTFSACDDHTEGCKCPPGFKGDGVHNCKDVDECTEKTACQCADCTCKNTWGSYECSCKGGLLYMREYTCIAGDSGKDGSSASGWSLFWILVVGFAATGVAGYAIYKYRIRRYMDSEIRAIMAQYMPLDNQGEVPIHIQRGDI